MPHQCADGSFLPASIYQPFFQAPFYFLVDSTISSTTIMKTEHPFKIF